MIFNVFYTKIKRLLGVSYSMAIYQFKARNEGTWLGVFWYLLNPILTFALLFLVFADRTGKNIINYPLYLIIGILVFNYFQRVTDESVRLIRENGGIIKSINFPKEALVVSVILKNLLVIFFETLILFLLLIFFKIPLINIFFYLFLLMFFSLFCLSFSLMISSLQVYFFDIDNIWRFASRLLWLATPIFYSIEGQNRLLHANLINPLYYFISIFRDTVIYSKFSSIDLWLGAILFTFIFMFFGLIIFNKLKRRFAELI